MNAVRTLGLVALFGPFASAAAWGQCVRSEQQTIVALDPAAGDLFGVGVAAGDGLLAVGASRHDHAASDGGAVYVFRVQGGVWTQVEELEASDATGGELLGVAVAVHGERIAAGAIYDNGPGVNSGSVFVYRFDGTHFVEEQKLEASDGGDDDDFGVSVDLSGAVLISGAVGDDDGGASAGAAYVFRHDGVQWVEEQKLRASDPITSHLFGFDVALDGDWAVVGASADNDQGVNAGAAYVYRFNGNRWREHTKLVAADGAKDDRFGQAVDVDGDRIAIGAPFDDDRGSGSGSVYLVRKVAGVWVEEQRIEASDAGTNTLFGRSVDLQSDRLLVGASGEHAGPASGSAYLFHFDGTRWVEVTKLVASDADSFDEFGGDVALFGENVCLGASGRDQPLQNAGAAYTFVQPDLALDASAGAVQAGDTLTLTTCGGLQAGPVLFYVVDVDGHPFLWRIAQGSFDADGRWSFGGTVPPGLTGITATFLALGLVTPKRFAASNLESIAFQ